MYYRYFFILGLLCQQSSAMVSPLNQAIASGASGCITYAIMTDWLGTMCSPTQTAVLSLAIDSTVILCNAMQNNSPSRIMSNALMSAGIYCLCVRPLLRHRVAEKKPTILSSSSNKEIYKDPSPFDPSHHRT